MVSQDRVHHLIQKIITVYFEGFAYMVKCCPKKIDPRHLGALGKKILETLRQSFFLSDAAKAGPVRASLGLLKREQSELKKTFPRRGRDPIRVPPSGIKHDPFPVSLRHIDQFVLQFERA